MVYINSSGTTELFTGAYNKRVEQNRNRAAAQAAGAEREDRMTAREYLGGSVEISEESREFMAGVDERKAAQIAAREAARAEQGGNIFDGTGDLKKQYLVLSENLYNNGFYDSLSDEEVRDMEEMLKNITAGMDSVNSSGFNRNFSTEMSHEAAKLELVSSVNALNYFADRYVPEEMRDSFKEVIAQYESYNSGKVAAHKSIYDLRDERMAAISAPNALNVSAAVKRQQEETKASAAIGKVSHTQEQEQANKAEYQAFFEQLMKGQGNAGAIFESLKSTLAGYASGGSKNDMVLSMLNTRNAAPVHNMMEYWEKLLQTESDSQVEQMEKTYGKAEKNVGISDESQLSERAQKLLEKLRKTYGNMDFMVLTPGADAKALLAGGTKEVSVLFSVEELEKMASSEKYEKEYMDRVQEALRMSEEIDQKFGFGSAFEENGGSAVTKIGISFNSDGTTSFFAELEKSSASQRERIEKTQEERRAQKKEDAKKAAADEQKERLEGNADHNVKRTTVQADSMEELLEKIRKVDWDIV